MSTRRLAMPKFRVIQEWVSHREVEIEADNYREAKHEVEE